MRTALSDNFKIRDQVLKILILSSYQFFFANSLLCNFLLCSKFPVFHFQISENSFPNTPSLQTYSVDSVSICVWPSAMLETVTVAASASAMAQGLRWA